MFEKIYKSSTPFFDTYWIYNPAAGQYVGILEDHSRGVTQRYFIGWHFPQGHYIPGSHQPGQTKMFDTEAEAIKYIVEG